MHNLRLYLEIYFAINLFLGGFTFSDNLEDATNRTEKIYAWLFLLFMIALGFIIYLIALTTVLVMNKKTQFPHETSQL